LQDQFGEPNKFAPHQMGPARPAPAKALSARAHVKNVG